MTTTINISLPKSLYEEAKKTVKARHYTSVSELVRDALRKVIKDEDPNEITVNGFTRAFEEEVLEAEKEPIGKYPAWTSGKDIDTYFAALSKEHKKKKTKKERNGKN